MIGLRRPLLVATAAVAILAAASAARVPAGQPITSIPSAIAGRVGNVIHRLAGRRSSVGGTSSAVDSVATPAALGGTDSSATHRSPVKAEAEGRYRRAGAAEPKSLQVITVPVPARFGGRSVDFAVAPAPQVDVLSSSHGTLPEAAPATDRAATIVARMPAAAAPGALEVAQVTFSDGTTSETVAVELEIAKVARVSLRPTRHATGVYPGQTIQLGLVVQNLGNGSDTLVVAADPMSGWRTDELPSFVLTPGQDRQLTITVHTPPPPASGTSQLVVRAKNGDSVLASVVLPVELLPDPSLEMKRRGPVVTAGVATAAGDGHGSSPVFGFQVNGPLTNSITLHGRFTQTVDRADFNAEAMSRVGYFVDGGYLNASGRGWTATAGRTGYSFSPLLGWNAGGLGVSADVATGPWSLGLLAVQQRIGGVAGGDQVGLKVGRRVGRGTATVTATHLDQSLVFARTLDAAGLGYSFSPKAGLTLGAEAGYRSAPSGEGAAFSTQLDQRSARGQFGIYAAHAPGGSAAFARATDELNGNLWRRLSPAWAVHAFGYATKDDPGTGNLSRAHGGAVGPSLQLGRRSIVSVDVSSHVSEYDATTGTTGSGELMTTLGLQTEVRGLNLNASVGAGRSSRSAELPGGGSFDRSGGRFSARGGIASYSPRGSFSIDGGIDKSSAITGQLATSGFVSAQGSQIRLFAGPHAPTFDAFAWLNLYKGAPTGGPAIRIGTEMALPGQSSLMLSVERNPYRRTTGSIPMVAAIRFEHSIGFSTFRRPTARGTVFEDRNGNGRRDDDETGLAGVLVHRGTLSVLTNADGSYRFYEAGAPNSVPAVDPGSLPMGQMAPNLPLAPGNTTYDLPVRQTGRLRVQLLPGLDSVGRFPMTRLNVLSAVATDSTGAAWIAHADSTGLAVFDALPAGRYTVSIDLSASSERLRQLQSPPEVVITDRQDLPILPLKFGFRPARVFNGGAAGTEGLRRR